MKHRVSAIGTPVLIALVLVSLVSLSARYYRDHGISRTVEAAAR